MGGFSALQKLKGLRYGEAGGGGRMGLTLLESAIHGGMRAASQSHFGISGQGC